MQRSSTVVRVAASLCPMRIRSNTQIKRINVVKERAAQWERDVQRRILRSGPVDLHSLNLAYPVSVTPEFVLKNGWCPPPEKTPDLPFQVPRTGKGGFIPVYRDMKNGRTRVITVVRKATGDLQVGTNHSGNVFPVWRNYSSCTDSRHHLEQRVPGVKIDTTPPLIDGKLNGFSYGKISGFCAGTAAMTWNMKPTAMWFLLPKY